MIFQLADQTPCCAAFNVMRRRHGNGVVEPRTLRATRQSFADPKAALGTRSARPAREGMALRASERRNEAGLKDREKEERGARL